MALKVLVTGGAGYIGSHTIVELLLEGHEVVCLDNFCNSSPKAIDRIIKICDKQRSRRPPLKLIEGDILNENLNKEIFNNHSINNVIHFAGLKAVGESGKKPIEYYKNNVEVQLNYSEQCLKRKFNKIVLVHLLRFMENPKNYPYAKNSLLRNQQIHMEELN